MAEVRREQKIYSVDMICDKCGKGRMRSTGILLTSIPEQYPCRCTECGCEEIYLRSYPHLEYVDVD